MWKRWGRTKLWVTLIGVGLIAFSGPLGVPAAAIPYIAGLVGSYVAAEGAADIRSRGLKQQPAGEKGAPK